MQIFGAINRYRIRWLHCFAPLKFSSTILMVCNIWNFAKYRKTQVPYLLSLIPFGSLWQQRRNNSNILVILCGTNCCFFWLRHFELGRRCYFQSTFTVMWLRSYISSLGAWAMFKLMICSLKIHWVVIFYLSWKTFLNNVFSPKSAVHHMRWLLIIWLKIVFGWVHGKLSMSVEEI